MVEFHVVSINLVSGPHCSCSFQVMGRIKLGSTQKDHFLLVATTNLSLSPTAFCIYMHFQITAPLNATKTHEMDKSSFLMYETSFNYKQCSLKHLDSQEAKLDGKRPETRPPAETTGGPSQTPKTAFACFHSQQAKANESPPPLKSAGATGGSLIFLF